MAEISKITLPTGTTYDIKDAVARQAAAGGVTLIGISTTEIADMGNQKPTIDGSAVTPTNGDLVLYESKEYVFVGEWNSTLIQSGRWHEFGTQSYYGDLAFKNEASGSYTPAGSVSQPTFTGASKTVTVSGTPYGSVVLDSTGSGDGYTPTGTVSQPTFTGSSLTSTGTFTATGSVGMASTGTGDGYTPAGSVSSSFSGTAATITSKNSAAISPTVTFTKNASGAVQLTGSVSKPDVTVTPSTTTVNSITAVGTLPTRAQATWSVSDETLTIPDIYSITGVGTLPTKGSDTTVMTGATAALASTPSLTMDKYNVTSSIAANGVTVTSSYTPAGSVSSGFTGTKVYPTFTGTSGQSISVSGTPAGTVSQPTFTGTKVYPKFTGTSGSFSGTYKPEGTVSQPTFTGTAATITVS